MKALIVVDMQNDFIDGSLAVPGAHEIIVPIQNYIRELVESNNPPYIAFTADAHPKNHSSFAEHGGQWPSHCVRGTRGADLQFGLQAIQRAWNMPLFQKGRMQGKEEYSGLENEALREELTRRGVTEIDVCGLARNYCVEATATAAKALGYKVTVLEHLCRAV